MGWFAAVGLIALVLFWLWRLVEFRGRKLEWLGAALLAGLAGYAWQGSPALPGHPGMDIRDRPAEGTADLDEDLVDTDNPSADRWIRFAEGLNRAGRHMDAAHAVQNGIETHPDDPDLWVALGNALLLHGEGQMNPAAQLAFQRAAQISPDHPGPPFFLGLALAQNGQLEDAEATWLALLERTPEDAPWRPDLESRLASVANALGRPAPVSEPPAQEDQPSN
ncbi:tetratricopeptide repeat protein [Parasphingopyxis marina]|uniref:Tetratricopeptide repeat protein n=1 Tax=Parasphingopyxis marina TaxID=2761622 RepID=A0A842HZX4_9SPHN|nr:tetratricopeptide repeat protein [Parasphingopyxis marina]MBC2777941.1 tetratricopeptide repeat protein [Parasphingopyxis marina]